MTIAVLCIHLNCQNILAMNARRPIAQSAKLSTILDWHARFTKKQKRRMLLSFFRKAHENVRNAEFILSALTGAIELNAYTVILIFAGRIIAWYTSTMHLIATTILMKNIKDIGEKFRNILLCFFVSYLLYVFLVHK